MTVTVDALLGFLVADTLAPSTFGAQLERLQYGVSSTPDPFRARSDAEDTILEQAELIRCLDAFAAIREFRPATARSDGFKTIEKIQRGTHPVMNQGMIALGVIKAYEKWGRSKDMRALVAVFDYVRSIAPTKCPSLTRDVHEAVQLFREGRAARSQELAASAYADALLALSGHCRLWSRRKS